MPLSPSVTIITNPKPHRVCPRQGDANGVSERGSNVDNELRAQLVNQLIEAGGKVVWIDLDGDVHPVTTYVYPYDFYDCNFYILEDGETPEKFQRPLA